MIENFAFKKFDVSSLFQSLTAQFFCTGNVYLFALTKAKSQTLSIWSRFCPQSLSKSWLHELMGLYQDVIVCYRDSNPFVLQIEQHPTICQYSLINYLLNRACPALVRLLELLASFASAEGNFLLLLQPFVA